MKKDKMKPIIDKSVPPPIQTGCFVLLLLLLLATPTLAKDVISGHYLSSDGKRIEVLIQIDHPAPTSLIIQQFFSPGQSPLNIFPRPGRVNPKKGSVKWFFKNPQAGQIKIGLQFKKPIQSSYLRTVLRCRQPETGHFVVKHIRP